MQKMIDSDGVDGSSLVAENRTLYSHYKPEEEVDMSHLMDNHEEGKFFPFVATTGDEVEDPGTRMERIMRFIPLIHKRVIKMPKRLNFNMMGEVEHISLSDIVGAKVTMEFFSVPRVQFSFTPTVSIRSNFSDVYITLVDSRFIGNKNQQQIILSSNKHYKGEMCIDYSIPTISMDKLEFAVAPAVPTLNTGEIWGAIQVEVEMRESDHPEVIPFKEVMAGAAFPTTGLDVHYRDPTKLNISILEQHLPELRAIRDRGEIPDVGNPMVSSQKKMTYASSRISSKPRMPENPSASDWDKIKKHKKTMGSNQSYSPPPSEDGQQHIDPKLEELREEGLESQRANNTSPAVTISDNEETSEEVKEALAILDGVKSVKKTRFNVQDV